MYNPTVRPVYCEKCDSDHERCLAHTSVGQPCKRWPRNGADYCPYHLPSEGAKIKAIESVASNQAREAVYTFGLPVEIDPHQALRDEIARTNGHIIWLQGIISEMEQKKLVFDTTLIERTDDFSGQSTTVRSEATINVWLRLYKEERTHLISVCRAAVACGLAEREIQLAEREGEIIARVIRQVIESSELGLAEDKRILALRLASQGLRSFGDLAIEAHASTT